MKHLTKLLFASLVIVFNYTSSAQVPQGIPYQSIIRNNSGALVANQNVKLRFSIRDSIATGSITF